MKFLFTEEDKKNNDNEIFIEEDNLTFIGESVEGEGKNYILSGKAIIDEETYSRFQVEFELLSKPKESTAVSIVNSDWAWYDFIY